MKEKIAHLKEKFGDKLRDDWMVTYSDALDIIEFIEKLDEKIEKLMITQNGYKED